jgi:hypothetical protein
MIKENVKNILFSQETISNSFTNRRNDLSVTAWYDKINLDIIKQKNNDRKKGKKIKSIYTQNDLIKLGVPDIFFKIQVFEINKKYYSCNNRRLCLLKKLFLSKVFDGNIEFILIDINQCNHEIVLKNNVIIKPSGHPCIDR